MRFHFTVHTWQFWFVSFPRESELHLLL